MQNCDVIVVGGGLVGLALARELHIHRFQVIVIDAHAAGSGASWAGAGMLSGSQAADVALRRLGSASARLYPTWVAELERETGDDCAYRPSGTLVLADPAAALPGALESSEWDSLTPAGLIELEPEIRPGDVGIWHLPHDHSIDNRALTAALLNSLRRRQVPLLENTPVDRIEPAEPGMRVIAGGRKFVATVVVNAAGAWAGAIPSPFPLPVRPRKGQLIALETGLELRHVVEAPGVYMVPRNGGRILVGATLDDVGFDATVSAETSRQLQERAARWVPALAAARLADAWIGFRPCSADEMPILGPTRCPGYWAATGHFRDGILLAPITAKILTQALITGELTRALDLTPFLPRRFEAN